jgi:hypothetical protein
MVSGEIGWWGRTPCREGREGLEVGDDRWGPPIGERRRGATYPFGIGWDGPWAYLAAGPLRFPEAFYYFLYFFSLFFSRFSISFISFAKMLQTNSYILQIFQAMLCTNEIHGFQRK